MKTLIKIIKSNIRNRGQILQLAIADQKKQYKGSDLGILWAFVKPTMYIGVFYAAISLGFKGAKDLDGLIEGCPYFVWLTIGMISWFFMSGMLAGGANVFRKYKIYVTKIKYPVEILPTILATSNLLVHMVLVLAALVMTVCFGVMPSIYWIEIIFYMALMYVFSIFWSMASGFIAAISKDFLNLLQAISQAFFWLSAILFDINSVDNETVRIIFMFNPISYVCEGYRNAVTRHIWFWQEPEKLLCYLITLAVMILVALLCYKKMRKVIPDYL